MSTEQQRPLGLRFSAAGLVEGETAAKMLGRSRDTVTRLHEAGIIKGIQMVPRGKWLYDYRSIVDYMVFLQAGGTAEEYLEKLRKRQ